MNQNKPASPATVCKRYLWEIAASMTAYVVAIYYSVHLLKIHPTGELHLAAALLPLAPLTLAFAAVIRFVAHTDEMLRRLHIEALAIAAGATAFLALTYGCLEMAGFPTLSAWWTFMCVDVVWGITACVLKWWRYR